MLKASIVPVTDFQQHCSIVYDDQTMEGVVVDPGGDVDRIAGAVEDLGVKVQDIWLTHGHLDHAGGAEACLLYTSPSPRDATLSRMPSSA